VVLGAIIGIPAFAVGKLQIGLSLSVGVLVGGLVFGWLRSVDRRFGRIPEPALWLFDSVGLAAFIAATGLRAGPDFVRGLQQSGLSLAIAGVLCTSIPFLLTILVGRYVIKMHPGVLLGVCAGAGTSAPGLAAVQEVAKSKIPTLGYGVTYAIGNVLLALWGSVMVVLMA
jgi:putative transport protein